MTPYHEALTRNRQELQMLKRGIDILIGRREKEKMAADDEILMLNKSKAAHDELIAQIDMELARKPKVPA